MKTRTRDSIYSRNDPRKAAEKILSYYPSEIMKTAEILSRKWGDDSESKYKLEIIQDKCEELIDAIEFIREEAADWEQSYRNAKRDLYRNHYIVVPFRNNAPHEESFISDKYEEAHKEALFWLEEYEYVYIFHVNPGKQLSGVERVFPGERK